MKINPCEFNIRVKKYSHITINLKLIHVIASFSSTDAEPDGWYESRPASPDVRWYDADRYPCGAGVGWCSQWWTDTVK